MWTLIGRFFLGMSPSTILILLGVLGFTGWIAKEKLQSYWKGVEKGQQSVITSVKKETDKVQNEWNKIDRSKLSADDAVRRLRDRASKGNN